MAELKDIALGFGEKFGNIIIAIAAVVGIGVSAVLVFGGFMNAFFGGNLFSLLALI